LRNRDLPRLLKALRAVPGCHAVKMHGSPWTEAGLWDVLCVIEGRAIWIEAKHDRDDLSPAQIRQRRLWSAAGARHVVAGPGSAIEDVVALVRAVSSDPAQGVG